MTDTEIEVKIDEIERLLYTNNKREALNNIGIFVDTITKIIPKYPQLTKGLTLLVAAIEREDYICAADYFEYIIKKIIFGKYVDDILYDESIVALPDVNEEIFYISSFDAELSLCIKDEHGKVYRMNSAFSPIHEVEVLLSNIRIEKNTKAICLFGLGTGILAEMILEELPSDGCLIIFEPEKRVYDYCVHSGQNENAQDAETVISHRIGKIKKDNRVVLYFGDDNEMSHNGVLTKKVDYISLSELRFAISPGYGILYEKECRKFINDIRNYVSSVVNNKRVFSFFKMKYIENVFRNLHICSNMNFSYDIGRILPREIPVVIVAAGPSLDRNIDLLKVVKGHFLIVAVDSAIDALVSRNIIPDLTVTLDPIKSVTCFSDERVVNIPCIVDINANPLILEKLNGRKFLSACNGYVLNLIKSLGKPIPEESVGGGSVATVAFAKFKDLKQKTIILIGQDLASSNGKTHAGNVDDGAGAGEIMIEGINGEQVYTRDDWLHYLKWYENCLEGIKKSGDDISVIDATEGGAKIRGTKIMTFQEVIDSEKNQYGNLPDYDFKKAVEKLDPCLNADEYKILCINHRENISKLKEIKVNAEDAVRISKGLIKGIEEKTISKKFIDKEKKKIKKYHEKYVNSSMHEIINEYLLGDILDEITHLKNSNEDEEYKNEINGIKLLQVSFEQIAYVADLIHDNALRYDHYL